MRIAHGNWAEWHDAVREYSEKHGYLPTPSDPVTASISFGLRMDGWHADSASDLWDLVRPAGGGNLVDRAAALIFLWDQSTSDPFLLSPMDRDEWEPAVRQVFAETVDSLATDLVESPWHARWELLFAAIVGHWNRANELARRWIAIAPTEEVGAWEALARLNFLNVAGKPAQDLTPDWWIRCEDAGDSAIGTLLVTLSALQVGDSTLVATGEWKWPESLTKEQADRVLEAAGAAARALEGDRTNAVVLAIAAWCDAVLGTRRSNHGMVRNAAAEYAGLATGEQLPPGARPLSARSSAVLYRLAGFLDDARQMAVLWTDLKPNDPEAWRFRAQVERQVGVEQWGDSWQHFLRLSPDTDNNWEYTELLRLLLESKDRTAADRALQELAFTHPERPVVEQLLRWDWPEYDRLCDSARQRWWNGLVFVGDPRVQTAFRATPWRFAVACFGEAVALELKARIFEPFLRWEGFRVGSLTDERDVRIAEDMTTGRATLGAMVKALVHTRNPSSAFGQALAQFLWARHRPLHAFCGQPTPVAHLWDLTELRNDAVHGDSDIEAGDARRAYTEAKGLLGLLVAQDPREQEISNDRLPPSVPI